MPSRLMEFRIIFSCMKSYMYPVMLDVLFLYEPCMVNTSLRWSCMKSYMYPVMLDVLFLYEPCMVNTSLRWSCMKSYMYPVMLDVLFLYEPSLDVFVVVTFTHQLAAFSPGTPLFAYTVFY